MKRIQTIFMLASCGLLGVVLEMVRRKALKERYALLWILSAVALIVLSMWGNMLEFAAKALGIIDPTNVVFPVMLFLGAVLFLYFSVLVTKQWEKIKTLAQKIALLEQRIVELEKDREKR
jgi:hypothetical protein